MKKLNRSLWIAGLAAASACVFAPSAWAGCGDTNFRKPASFVTSQDNQGGMLIPVNQPALPIVGMWSVSFLAGGTQIDFGYQVWHDDGTEFMNSGGRMPVTQNYCLGVWQQTGPVSFKLNHFAISYDTSGNFNGRVNIREEVVVNGNTYSGPFTIDVYDPKTDKIVNHVGGRIVGQRIGINTTP
ncbi:MAG TPA: hypothetical protein VN723_00845 [Rhizomicrobium sp.]|nr:hypothetical protein [Rhizomicrobium sp.]